MASILRRDVRRIRAFPSSPERMNRSTKRYSLYEKDEEGAYGIRTPATAARAGSLRCVDPNRAREDRLALSFYREVSSVTREIALRRRGKDRLKRYEDSCIEL